MNYEDVYLKEHETGAESNSSLSRLFDYCDYHRPHQELGLELPRVFCPKRLSDRRTLSNVRPPVVRIMGSTSTHQELRRPNTGASISSSLCSDSLACSNLGSFKMLSKGCDIFGMSNALSSRIRCTSITSHGRRSKGG